MVGYYYHGYHCTTPTLACRGGDVQLGLSGEAEATGTPGPQQGLHEGGAHVLDHSPADDADGVCCVQGRRKIVSGPAACVGLGTRKEKEIKYYLSCVLVWEGGGERERKGRDGGGERKGE